jgi:hypothetical protein
MTFVVVYVSLEREMDDLEESWQRGGERATKVKGAQIDQVWT